MKKSKRVFNNLIWGAASQLLTILLGIILPRLVLTSYGSEINGLINSVTQIYSYIALLEAGIGTATVQALYKTLGEENQAETNAVLAATNRYYHRTGVLYLIAILLFSTLYPFLITTDIDSVTVALIIVFNGLGNVINYFFQAKYMLLLQADGKNFVQTQMNMAINVLKNVAKIILMACGADVVFVQMIGMFVSLIQMAYIGWYVKTRYTWIDLRVKPNYDAISQSRNVLVHQVSGLIFNNTDMIILTVFCGLKVVSVYSMYSLLLGMIGTALSTVTSSLVFVLGQTYHSDRAKYKKMFECYELYYMALVFALYAVANLFLVPFLRLYTQGVEDINYIDPYMPMLCISTHLLSSGRSATNQAITFAGHFKLTQNRAILESVINLVASLIAVQFLGIYGVILGTIAALLYRSNDIILYANKHILQRNPWNTYRRWLLDLLLYVCVSAVGKWLLSFADLDSYGSLFFWAVISCVTVLCLFFAVVSCFDREVYQDVKNLLYPKMKDITGRLKGKGR